jgi:hypothetical protein
VRRWTSLLALLLLPAGCDFDGAFKRYCQGNPQCRSDARPETGLQAKDAATGAGTGPEIKDAAEGPETGLEIKDAATGAETGPDTAFLPPRILPPRNCTSSDQCQGPDNVCHPFGKVCLKSCSSAADCPPWLDTCAEIRDPYGTASTPKVCTCSMAASCDKAASGFACNFLDGLCEKECQGPSECAYFQPPRVCDQMAGLCMATMPNCSVNAHCPAPSQPRCDTVNRRCVSCASNNDCVSRPDGLARCDLNGSCIAP